MELKTIKVKPDIKKSLKIRSAKLDISIREMVDRILRNDLSEAGDLVE